MSAAGQAHAIHSAVDGCPPPTQNPSRAHASSDGSTAHAETSGATAPHHAKQARAQAISASLGRLDAEAANAIGPRIRRLRLERQYSLRELAKRSSLSAGFLSLVERGHASLALASLFAVARALDVPPAYLLDDVRDALSRPNQLVRCLARSGQSHFGTLAADSRTYRLLSAHLPNAILEPMIVSFPPRTTTDVLASHPGEEFAFVLRGEITYMVRRERLRLRENDSLHLLSTTPHSVSNDTGAIAELLWVQTPPVLNSILRQPPVVESS